jgi:hypothetical protein
MAAILLGYFGTMVTIFAAGMFCLASILDTATVRHARPEAPRLTASARAMLAERMASNTPKQAELAELQVAVPTAAAASRLDAVAASDDTARMTKKQIQKAKLLKIARNERRRERLASRQSYSTTALGYAPESPTRTAADRIFNTIRQRR